MTRLMSHTIVVACLLTPMAALAAEDLCKDKLVIQAEIARDGDFVAFGFDSLWMMSNRRLARVDPVDNSVIDIDIPGNRGTYRGVAIGDSAVWIPDTGTKTIYKVDPASNSVTKRISADLFDSEGSIGVGEGAVWIVTLGEKFQTFLTRFNAQSGATEANISLPSGSVAVIVDYASVWATSTDTGELYRIDPKANAVARIIPLHGRPRFLASGEGSIWVFNQTDGSIHRIDGQTGTLTATIETGEYRKGDIVRGGDIAVGGGYVWVSLKEVPVIQIDPSTNRVVRKYQCYGLGDGIRYGAGSLWVSGSHIYRIQPPS